MAFKSVVPLIFVCLFSSLSYATDWDRAAQVAAMDGDWPTMEEALQNGASLVAPEGERTPLTWAVVMANADRTFIESLISLGSDINHLAHRGESALWWAAMHDDSQMIALLLELGANIDIQDEEDVTPLWIASVRGNLDAVRALIENGADPAIKGSFMSSKNYYTPLEAVRDGGPANIANYHEIVRALQSAKEH